MSHSDRTNIAVFIDFDNIEIGVRTTLHEHFDIGTILEALKERGEVVTKVAYADWTRAGEYSRALTQHAIRLVQRNLTPGGDKNGADINLALDALEMVFSHPHINAFVIVGGDSDFLSLVEKLKQYDKKVFVVGGRAFTSIILQRNCHEFIAYENLIRPRGGRGQRGSGQAAAAAITQTLPITQAFAIARRALKVLSDREVSPQTGLLKSTLLQLDSTFSERTYGASSFLDFVEKLAQAGLVLLKHSGRSVMVELNPAFEEDGEGRVRVDGDGLAAEGDLRVEGSDAAAVAAPSEPVEPLGDNADGVRRASQLLGAATSARWPMYLRNVKQVLRAAQFDERKYGFLGLMELLKACQRENIVRVERDRRGGLRVFQGSAFVSTAAPGASQYEGLPLEDPALDADEPLEAQPDDETQPFAPVPVVPVTVDETDEDAVELAPVDVVDTTAELLGQASGRGRRTRSTLPPTVPAAKEPARARGARGGARKTAAKKTAATGTAKRTPRGKKASSDDDSFGNR